MDNFSKAASKAVCALTGACFIWMAVSIFICNHYSYNVPILVLLTLNLLALTVIIWQLIKRHEAFFMKHRKAFTWGFLIMMGAVQTAMIFPLRYTPVFDIGALYGGAAEWVTTGDFASYYEYFSMFHNNWGGLLLLRVIFGLAKLVGITDFFIVASVFNSVLSLASMCLTGSVCEKLLGFRGRLLASLMFIISPPYYFIAPAFYTDALTMVFPILILYLYLVSREQEKPIKRLALFALIGLAAGIGYSIKATAVIMLIAVMIDAFLNWDIKKCLPLILVSIAIMLLCRLVTHGIIYRHIDRRQVDEEQIPILHWVMMGTQGSGMYDPGEYEFTKSFLDPSERRDAVRERLFSRLRSYNAIRFAQLFTTKLDIDFGDGTYGLSDCLGCPHGEDNALHLMLLKGGSVHNAYKHICTGALMALYLLIIVSSLFEIFGRCSAQRAFAPRLALLGLVLFLLFWEARWRYFSNYSPIIITAAVSGLECVLNKLFPKISHPRCN